MAAQVQKMGTYTKSGGRGGRGTNQRAGGPGKITFDSAPGVVTKSWGLGVFPWLLHKHAFEGLSEQVLH